MGVCAANNNKSIKGDPKLSPNKPGQDRLSNQSLQILPKQCIRGLQRCSTINSLREIKKKIVYGPYDLQKGFHKKYSVLRVEDTTLYCQNNSTTQLTKVTILERNTTHKHSYFQQIQQHDLKCVNISQYIESYQEKNQIYLIQEQLKGGNLSQVLKKNHLNYHQALIIIEQIINAIHHLHQQHLSHGSLTIDSFVFSDPESLLVKLSDLGPIFHYQDELSKRNIILEYASPENKKSAKSDVWSIGIIFYQLITSEILKIPTDYEEIINWDPFQELSIPEKGIQGLTAMLQFDSHERCSLTQIIEKGYFKSEINKEAIISCVIQLGQLKKMTNLQQILIQFMMNKFQSEQVQILSKVFQYADLDNNGSITKDELKNLLHEIHLEEQFVNEIIESVFSILNEGNLSKDKFIVLASNKQELLVDYNIEQTYKILSNYQGGMTVKSISRQITITNESQIRDEIQNEFPINQFDLVIFSNFIKQVL